MEALHSVSVALLTIYDMCKALDKGMEIEFIHLDKKTGGKSGIYLRSESAEKKEQPNKRSDSPNKIGLPFHSKHYIIGNRWIE